MANGDKREDCRGAGREREIVYVQPAYMGEPDDEIDLLELWSIIWRGKWFIVGFTLLCTIGAIIYSFVFLTPKYKAEATLETTKESKSVIVNYLGSNIFHKHLINKYNLLPKLYPKLWNEQAEEWVVPQEDKPSVNKVLASEKGIPLEVEISGELISLTWEGTNPQFCADILEEIIKELRMYLNDDFVSPAQRQKRIYKDELAFLKEYFEDYWDKAWTEDNLSLKGTEVLTEYTQLKSQVIHLKVQDEMSRVFEIIDEPIVPQNPFEPNKKLPVVLSFVLGIFVSVFFVFFWNFVRNARGRLKEKQG